MLVSAWFVALHLTKNRVTQEGLDKLESINRNKTPFLWDFTSFKNQVVESFQTYWEKNEYNGQLVAKTLNPHISLNFSGKTLNTLLHETLIIKSVETTGTVKIQVRNENQNALFYYLSPITLTGKTQVINLKQQWIGYDASGKIIEKVLWGEKLKSITSLVLQFKEQQKTIKLKAVSLPYTQSFITVKPSVATCDGLTIPINDAQDLTVKHFILKEKCLFPSTYMWLKKQVTKLYPESLLTIGGTGSLTNITPFNINKSYTNIFRINAKLYGFLFVCFVIVYTIRKKNTFKQDVEKQELWYKELAKQLLFKGAKKAIKPYSLMLNYSTVLIPTISVLILMAFIKFPELTSFKKLPLYFLWALVQQFFLGFFLAKKMFYNKTNNRLVSALLAGTVFSLLHLPSMTLVIATFIAGGLWAYSYLIFRRIIPLAISHAVLALMFYSVTSNHYLYSAKVLQWFWE